MPSVFISALSGVQDDSPSTGHKVHVPQYARMDLQHMRRKRSCLMHIVWCSGLRIPWISGRQLLRTGPVSMQSVSISTISGVRDDTQTTVRKVHVLHHACMDLPTVSQPQLRDEKVFTEAVPGSEKLPSGSQGCGSRKRAVWCRDEGRNRTKADGHTNIR